MGSLSIILGSIITKTLLCNDVLAGLAIMQKYVGELNLKEKTMHNE